MEYACTLISPAIFKETYFAYVPFTTAKDGSPPSKSLLDPEKTVDSVDRNNEASVVAVLSSGLGTTYVLINLCQLVNEIKIENNG